MALDRASVSPFRDDWLDCMKAAYIYAVRTNDTNRDSLRRVMIGLRLSDSELEELEIRAKMRET